MKKKHHAKKEHGSKKDHYKKEHKREEHAPHKPKSSHHAKPSKKHDTKHPDKHKMHHDKDGEHHSKNWIAGAIKHPGSLRKELHVKKGHKIPVAKLKKAAHHKGKEGQRARLAETLRKLGHRHKKKGE